MIGQVARPLFGREMPRCRRPNALRLNRRAVSSDQAVMALRFRERRMGRFAWSTLSVLIAGLVPALGQAPAQAPVDDAALCRSASGDAAIAACTHAIAGGKLKDRNLAIAYNKRGSEQERKGEPDKAIVDYDEALRADPTFVVVYVNRAQVFRRRRELDRAI